MESDIRGPIEWPAAVISVNRFLDEIEDHYERGQGNIALPQAGKAPVLSERFRRGIYDSRCLDGSRRGSCLDRIARDQPKNGGDGFFFDLPNCRFERTASCRPQPISRPAIRRLQPVAVAGTPSRRGERASRTSSSGSDPTTRLGTIVRMDVKKDGRCRPSSLRRPRTSTSATVYNLWSEEALRGRVRSLLIGKRSTTSSAVGRTDCKVFVGTVPKLSRSPRSPRASGTSGMRRIRSRS